MFSQANLFFFLLLHLFRMNLNSRIETSAVAFYVVVGISSAFIVGSIGLLLVYMRWDIWPFGSIFFMRYEGNTKKARSSRDERDKKIYAPVSVPPAPAAAARRAHRVKFNVFTPDPRLPFVANRPIGDRPGILRRLGVHGVGWESERLWITVW
jgi:hypothetical protein